MRKFEQRYLFSGKLVLKTALHIGGGDASLGTTDSPIVRRANGQPFIPGSSFKGSFRSTVEKLAATVGIHSCGLMENEDCVGAQGAEQKKFNDRRQSDKWNEADLLTILKTEQCETCWLFGSPYVASRIFFSDLYLAAGEDAIIERRDGVAIDRDSERAVDKLLYNYEVVPATLNFAFEIMLEDPQHNDLGLTCLGLSEFVSGFGGLGGKRSRGLGNCQIDKFTIHMLDLSVNDISERAKRLKKYLLGKTPDDKMMVVSSPVVFLDQQIETLLSRTGGQHA